MKSRSALRRANSVLFALALFSLHLDEQVMLTQAILYAIGEERLAKELEKAYGSFARCRTIAGNDAQCVEGLLDLTSTMSRCWARIMEEIDPDLVAALVAQLACAESELLTVPEGSVQHT